MNAVAPALVSVVMPVYNGARFLPDSIRSVLSQTHEAVELIAVDDGSTDHSVALLGEYQDRVTVLRQANQGVASARNLGIAHARGELVAFLDQDDWWRPEKIARQVAEFSKHPDVALVHTAAAHFDDVTSSYLERPLFRSSPELIGHCHERLLLRNGILNSSVVVRRRVLQTVGGFDTAIGGNSVQDYDLWLRITKEHSLAFLSEELVVYRLHSDQGFWDRRRMLTQELALLERHGPAPSRRSKVMRRRLAKLFNDLGVAHLDAAEPRLARRYFALSVRDEWTMRHALFLAASFLPLTLVRRLREIRAASVHG